MNFLDFVGLTILFGSIALSFVAAIHAFISFFIRDKDWIVFGFFLFFLGFSVVLSLISFQIVK